MSTSSLDLSQRLRTLSWQQPLLSPVMLIMVIFLTLLALSLGGVYLSTNSLLVLAVALLSAGAATLLALARTYAYINTQQAPVEDGLAATLSYDAVAALRLLPRSQPNATASQVFAALHATSPFIRDICLRLEMPLPATITAFDQALSEPVNLAQLAQQAQAISQQRPTSTIRPGDFLQALLTQDHLRIFLRQHSLQSQDIVTIMHRYHWLEDKKQERQQWWQPQHLLAFTGLGLSFASGFTTFVDRFAQLPSGQIWDVIDGHESELNQLITSLARERQSNVLLVGSPGAGTMGLIKELYQRLRHQQTHPALNNQRLLYLHLAQIATLGATPSEQQSIVTRALNEMEHAGNIIVVLDGISSILGGSGTLNASEVLAPFLSSPAVRVVALISPDDYRRTIQPQPDLLEFFAVINVPPLTADATLRLLVRTISTWESRYHVFVPYSTLRELVTSTEHILPFMPFPEKAFDTLEDAVSSEQSSGDGLITAQDIQRLISQKININIGDISAHESRRLLNLEHVMHERVINQRTAITAVSRAMVRARAGTRDPNKPVGTFLFLGPTGVGKTQTAKALAHAYFGSDKRLQRLDMTQFQGQTGVEQLLGNGIISGQLTSFVSDNPFSVLLLDEFEKADSLVQQIFMPVFDEGYITDNSGRQYSFANTILIATSNAGSEYIRQQIGESGHLPPNFTAGLREHILTTSIFTPELLNRFDGVITFTPLSRHHIEEIAALMLRGLNQRLDAAHGVTVAITPELVNFLTEIGYDPDFGARPMARAIQDTVEYAVAEQITRNAIKPGQSLQLNPDHLRQLQAEAY